MIRFEPGPERCNGYFQISWTPTKTGAKQQLIHACIKGNLVFYILYCFSSRWVGFPQKFHELKFYEKSSRFLRAKIPRKTSKFKD